MTCLRKFYVKSILRLVKFADNIEQKQQNSVEITGILSHGY